LHTAINVAVHMCTQILPHFQVDFIGKLHLCLQHIHGWTSSTSIKASCERFTNCEDFCRARRLLLSRFIYYFNGVYFYKHCVHKKL